MRDGHAAQTVKQEMTALLGGEICWKWRFGILLGFENNTKTDIKKRAISMVEWFKVALVKCSTAGLANSKLHPELL